VSCPCGERCETNGTCQVDGTCSDSTAVVNCVRANVCPAKEMKCLRYCPNGNKIDAQGCPTCDCESDEAAIAAACACGQPCEMKSTMVGKGTCQANGACVASSVAPDCAAVQCPQMMCMVFCPNGHAVDANGCPMCKCNPTCACGQDCKTEMGMGTCQEDGQTCAVTARVPECLSIAKLSAPSSCPVKECAYCEYGSVLDANGCETCQCQAKCPCGQLCSLTATTLGVCQNDGVNCVRAADMGPCAQVAGGDDNNNNNPSDTQPETSNKSAWAALIVIGLLVLLSFALLLYRRHSKRSVSESTYADLDPAGYVAPAAQRA